MKGHFAIPRQCQTLSFYEYRKDERLSRRVRSMPIRKEDEVMVVRGRIPQNKLTFKGPYKSNKGKVTCVYRKRWYINVEKLSKPKINGKASPRSRVLI